MIFVTHGHGDHVGCSRHRQTYRCAGLLHSGSGGCGVCPCGVACVAGNLGGTVRLSFGCAKFFQALHGGGAAAVLPAASF
ncbi:MAG: hypothetical protein ACLTYN_09165 [Dysosmobacter welbionis]